MRFNLCLYIVIASVSCSESNMETTTENTSVSVDITHSDILISHVEDTANPNDSQNQLTGTVEGRVRYLKRMTDSEGKQSTLWHVVRRATVQLVTHNQTIETTTNENGEFKFTAESIKDGIVRVVAKSIGPRCNLRVTSGDNEPTYYVEESANSSLSIDIEESYMAGAFNVVEMGLRVGDALMDLVPDDVPEQLQVHWGPLVLPSCGSCFFSDSHILKLGGQTNETDAHDDSVVLHELGHFVESTWGTFHNPTGPHDIQFKVVPTLAWSEGFATWFQAEIRDEPNFVDARPNKLYLLDLESPPKITLGTRDEFVTSDHSEALVYGILWDLSDDYENDDDNANFSRNDVLKAALNLMSPDDIGFPGADLVNFLNQFRCSVENADTSLSPILAAFEFPYEINAQPICTKQTSDREPEARPQ